MIIIKGLYKTYNIGKQNEVHALKGLNLEISQNEILAIIGRSGAGKSTLLHILSGIDGFDSGSVNVDGIELLTLNDKQISQYRNKKVGIVLQDFALIDSFSVYENVEIPLIFSKVPKSKRKILVAEALKNVGLQDLKSRNVTQLSGGQKQRVAIARAIVNNPEYIFADEPTGALDSKTSEEIFDLLKELNKKGKTIIIVTHDKDIANGCNSIIKINDGAILSE